MTSTPNPPARSPYQRRAKRPFRYSPQLEAIEEARKRGDHFEADRLGRAHSASYGLFRSRPLSSIGPEIVDW